MTTQEQMRLQELAEDIKITVDFARTLSVLRRLPLRVVEAVLGVGWTAEVTPGIAVTVLRGLSDLGLLHENLEGFKWVVGARERLLTGLTDQRRLELHQTAFDAYEKWSQRFDGQDWVKSESECGYHASSVNTLED